MNTNPCFLAIEIIDTHKTVNKLNKQDTHVQTENKSPDFCNVHTIAGATDTTLIATLNNPRILITMLRHYRNQDKLFKLRQIRHVAELSTTAQANTGQRLAPSQCVETQTRQHHKDAYNPQS